VTILQGLADSYTAVPRYKEILGGTHRDLGVLYGQYKRPMEKVEAEFRAAMAEFQRLEHDYSDVPSYKLLLAGTHNNLGIVLHSAGSDKDAEAEWRKALAVFQQLADQHSDVPLYREHVAGSHLKGSDKTAGTGIEPLAGSLCYEGVPCHGSCSPAR
jgi:hypothetical protein